MTIHNAPQINTPNGYEYQNDEVPADRNFLSDLHGPDGMVSYADVLRLLATRAVPTVDDDAVERAADAIHSVDRRSFEVRHIPERSVYIDRARAALAAAGITPGDAREGGEGDGNE